MHSAKTFAPGTSIQSLLHRASVHVVEGDMYSLTALLGSEIYSVGGDHQFPTFRYLLNSTNTFFHRQAIENAT